MYAGRAGASTPAPRSPASPRCAGCPNHVLGAYGHGVFAALQTLTGDEAASFGGLRERCASSVRRVIFATGAVERLIAFPATMCPA